MTIGRMCAQSQPVFSLACAHVLCKGYGMSKTTRIFVRMTEAEKARLQSACNRDGKVMSEVCRKLLLAFAAKSERKNKAEDT